MPSRATDPRCPQLRATAADEKRVERQRTLFNALPSSDAVDRLKEAMAQRAYDLLWEGDSACDALLEFLPSSAVDEVLAAWDNDIDDDKPKSRFH